MKITNTAGKSIVIRIIDQCPECPTNRVDLSEDAFQQLGDTKTGILPVTMEFVECQVTGNIGYRMKNEATKWWQSVVVYNHRVGVKKFEMKGSNTNWIEYKRKSYNEFEGSHTLELPISMRVTSINGEVITDNNIIRLFQSHPLHVIPPMSTITAAISLSFCTAAGSNIPGHYTSSQQFMKSGLFHLYQCQLPRQCPPPLSFTLLVFFFTRPILRVHRGHSICRYFCCGARLCGARPLPSLRSSPPFPPFLSHHAQAHRRINT